MAVTEVIRFRLDTQDARGVGFSTLNLTFLFEHSPPARQLFQWFSHFDP